MDVATFGSDLLEVGVKGRFYYDSAGNRIYEPVSLKLTDSRFKVELCIYTGDGDTYGLCSSERWGFAYADQMVNSPRIMDESLLNRLNASKATRD